MNGRSDESGNGLPSQTLMKSFALIMLAMLALGGSTGHAALTTQPTPKAAERARATKEAIKSFRL